MSVKDIECEAEKMDSTSSLWTFTMVDSSKQTYAGENYRSALCRLLAYGSAPKGEVNVARAVRCDCGTKRARITRELGFLICRTCAGYLG